VADVEPTFVQRERVRAEAGLVAAGRAARRVAPHGSADAGPFPDKEQG